MATTNVLIFPCGAENAIVIHNALKYNVNFKVFGASSKNDHGRHVFENYIGGIPFIQDEDFISIFNQVLFENKIEIIFPAHDTVSKFLAENRKKILSKIAVPDTKTAQICHDKGLIYDKFKNSKFCPQVYNWNENIVFPVFIKPKIGSGGKNTALVKSQEELNFFKKVKNDFLLVEFLPGDEITVDCFTDRHGKLRFAGPRNRKRVFGGISVQSQTIPLTKEIKNISEEINNKLKFRGLWFFQLKKDQNDQYKLLEISIRTSSTMSLYSSLGVNFHLLTAYDLLGFDVEIIKNNYQAEVDRSLANRFLLSLDYNTVYIDFDDTITRNKKINEFVMLFLYQLVRKNKRIILLTRHEFNILNTLYNLKIDKRLFSEIKTLDKNQPKSEAILDSNKVIFIDNSYQERCEVKKKLGIPVFDVDAIQSLIDWRE
jgi:hypothetical protein